METQNLAIVFGPTLLTTSDLMSLVTDTSHQCRIVESLINHVSPYSLRSQLLIFSTFFTCDDKNILFFYCRSTGFFQTMM